MYIREDVTEDNDEPKKRQAKHPVPAKLFDSTYIVNSPGLFERAKNKGGDTRFLM